MQKLKFRTFCALDFPELLVCYRAHFSAQETAEKPRVAISSKCNLKMTILMTAILKFWVIVMSHCKSDIRIRVLVVNLSRKVSQKYGSRCFGSKVNFSRWG